MSGQIVAFPKDRVRIERVSGPLGTASADHYLYAIDAVTVDGRTMQFCTLDAWKASRCDQAQRHQTILTIGWKEHHVYRDKQITSVENG